ncbi:gamma-glutamylcyclotransferase [Malaciobacter molluscorum]|uniref:gamma-glutamylcyclotransferase n=1 Tax=Malaciobacter molluscorum TaxID=1032072 RepID=UPI00100AA254|nr:gamma-glutamylcyclotransferase [Malaciobacter molluscorum]RXJ97294.1 gamma-glutamylcyclotransferase [Malaciobacter molluscorum]
MYLFGYGSLINLNSAQKSFKRKISYKDLIPVKIKGLKKVWNAIEVVDFDDEKQVNTVFLNLQKDENSYANGVVVKITEDELELLKLREKNYSNIIIDKKNVTNMTLDEDIITFMTTNEEKIAKKTNTDCVIASKYIDILTNSFENYDDEFVKEYKQQTLSNFPFELKEGTYKFSDPIQNKLAKEGVNEQK